MDDLLDVVIDGTPISLQGRSAAWKAAVAVAAEEQVAEERQLNAYLVPEVEVAIVYFHVGEMEGDLDNIAKPILDGLNTKLWSDDRQVARLTLRRERLDGTSWAYEDIPPALLSRLEGTVTLRPFVFVRAMQYRRSVSLP